MPCSTGRSSHVLCNPGCADANACCRQTTAFSCQRFCACDDSRLSPNNQEVSLAVVRRAHCDALENVNLDPALGSAEMAVQVCVAIGSVVPALSYDCVVSVYLQPAVGDAIPLVSVHRGSCTVASTVNDTDLTGTGVHTLFVDSLPCGSFTF